MPHGNIELRKGGLILPCETPSHQRRNGVYKLWFHGCSDSWKVMRDYFSNGDFDAFVLDDGVEKAGRIVEVSPHDLDWFLLFQPEIFD